MRDGKKKTEDGMKDKKVVRKKIIDEIKTQFLDALFPPRCPICDEIIGSKEVLHRECYQKLRPYPMRNIVNEYGRRQSENNLDDGRTLFAYEKEAKSMMYRFKYDNRRDYASFFAKEITRRYKGWMEQNKIDLIVPVPMYKKNEKARGYNQANCLAKELSKEMEIAWNGRLVKRIKKTPALKNLSAEKRKNNLKNAFHMEEDIVKYSYILIVDDIYTTGSTAQELAGVLKAHGAKKVYIITVCKGDYYERNEL